MEIRWTARDGLAPLSVSLLPGRISFHRINKKRTAQPSSTSKPFSFLPPPRFHHPQISVFPIPGFPAIPTKGTMARYSPPLLRRFFSCAASSASPSGGSGAGKKNLVFLGSPQVLPHPQNPSFSVHAQLPWSDYWTRLATQVAASVLDTLLAASGSPESGFQVAAVVTQPPAAKNRGRKLMPSAVAQLALDRGFPEELIFTPERAREVSFLTAIL